MTTMTARGGAGEIRRPLSPMERWYWICDQISPLNVIARVHVAGAWAPQDVAWAGARLADEHPLLRVAVAAEPDGSRPRFVAARDPRIPIRTVHCDKPAADRWEREVNDVELVTSLDWCEGPMARIVDVARDAAGAEPESHDLILTVSHVIADASAALELLRRLVELAAGRAAATGTAAGADTAPPTLRPREPLPPPEALLPKRINGLPRAAHLVAWLVADWITAALARPRRLAPTVPLPPDQRRTQLIRRELDATQLDKVIARCRREKVTVHSALAAAMALAVSDSVADAGRAGRRRRTAIVTIGSPVDFRAELVPPVGRQDAGAYVAAVPLYVPAGPAVDLWAAARSAFRDLRRSKRFHHHLALVSMLRFMCPPSVGRSARAVTLVDRVVPDTCLSNVGRHDFPGRVGRWQLSGAQFVSGISLNGYLTATVTTSHGALHWNFTYIEGAVTRKHAEQIAHQAVRILVSGPGPDETKPLDSRYAETPASTTTRG
jgi:hypothetical protein